MGKIVYICMLLIISQNVKESQVFTTNTDNSFSLPYKRVGDFAKKTVQRLKSNRPQQNSLCSCGTPLDAAGNCSNCNSVV